MPKAGATRQRNAERMDKPLPVAARRRLWDAVWDRLLTPNPDERQAGGDSDWVETVDDSRPLSEPDGRRSGEAA